MPPWTTSPLLALDLETTGADPRTARVVTASAVLVSPRGELLHAPHTWLVDPGVPIPAEASAIHGIDDAQARGGCPPAVAVAALVALLRAFTGCGAVVAFNGSYDLTVLDRECRRHAVAPLGPALGRGVCLLDPYVVDKEVDRFRRGTRSLARVAEHYGVGVERSHEATADALAAAGVALALARRFPWLAMEPARLHALQVRWRARQAASSQARWRAQEPAAVVEGEWPVLAAQTGEEC